MRRHLITTPMPVVLSFSTPAEADTQFGAGSLIARAARLAIEGPRVYPAPTPEELAERVRLATLHDLADAFRAVGECIALVEAHAVALYEVDQEARFGCAMDALRYWRSVAFASLALLYARTPELLPIGQAVHAFCGDDDR